MTKDVREWWIDKNNNAHTFDKYAYDDGYSSKTCHRVIAKSDYDLLLAKAEKLAQALGNQIARAEIQCQKIITSDSREVLEKWREKK